MNDKDRRIHDGKPNIAVIADPDGLAVNLVEILLSEICRVNIVSEKTASWNYLSLIAGSGHSESHGTGTMV